MWKAACVNMALASLTRIIGPAVACCIVKMIATNPQHPDVGTKGQFRYQVETHQYCSRAPDDLEGPPCLHGAISQEDHWSCCGELSLTADCPGIRAMVGDTVKLKPEVADTDDRVLGANSTNRGIGVIVKDDKDTKPLKVELREGGKRGAGTGSTSFYREAELVAFRCTYNTYGSANVPQRMFTCRRCTVACCEGCRDFCHEGHELASVGMKDGGSTCECSLQLCCKMQPLRLSYKVGDRVRVKSGVDPAYGWGDVSSSEIGFAKAIEGDLVRIEFPSDRNWIGHGFDMEKVDTAGYR